MQYGGENQGRTRASCALLGSVAIALAMLWPGDWAAANVYTGSLSYSAPSPADAGDGLYVVGDYWPGYNVTIEWVVTDSDPAPPSFPWKYTYHLVVVNPSGGVLQKGLSHVVIEASPGIEAADVPAQYVSGASLLSVGLQEVSSGNPGMPEDVNGLRFNPLTTSPFDIEWSFFTNRAPVWGDIFIRGGGGGTDQSPANAAWNYNMSVAGAQSGFLDPDNNDTTLDDPDPTAPPANGSLNFHILRPDSRVDPPSVPEPSCLALLLVGTLALFRRRSRK